MSNFINGFEIDVYNQFKFKDRAKQDICPFCSHLRKKKTDKCVSLDWEKAFFNCWHCGESGQLHTYKKKEAQRQYKKPVISQIKKEYSDNFIKYITNTRGIDLSALKALKVREAKEWMPQTQKEENCICFDYYLNSEIINVKYRDGRKNFKLYKDAEKIFYNLDNIQNDSECVIVEGEFDVLAYYSAGVRNVVSVPNGFNLKGESINLDYLDNYIEYFETKETIFIAVDNDPAGQKGQAELIRRLGAEKCKLVSFNDCKDANEYLLKYGKESLANTVKLAKDVKIDGVFSLFDVGADLLNNYRNGQQRGETTGVPEIDKAWTWRNAEVNLWTGYQNEGKTALLMQLCLIRAIMSGVKVGVFSPENFPLKDFYNDLIETYIGKSCDPYYSNNYMSEEEFKEAMVFINDHFFVIYPEKDFTINTIFDKASYLVKKHGIRTLVIDPYNTVEHLMNGEREDLYISKFMSKLKRFAVEKDLSINLVAHQLTAIKNEKDGGRYYKPDLNKIKGGGTFADKADNVLFVWRPDRAIDFKSPDVIFGSQKIKKQRLVGIPQNVDQITYNIRDSRYYFNGVSPFTLFDKKRKGEDFDKEPDPVFMSPEQAFETYESDNNLDIPF